MKIPIQADAGLKGKITGISENRIFTEIETSTDPVMKNKIAVPIKTISPKAKTIIKVGLDVIFNKHTGLTYFKNRNDWIR